MPEHIAFLLLAVDILLGYGRHLLGTDRQRATTTTFTAVAACFGTANLSTILAHLNRGITGAAALERVLLARAATGSPSPAQSGGGWEGVKLPDNDPASDRVDHRRRAVKVAQQSPPKSALAELEAAPSLGFAVLLPLDHA
jgi:hypothetical protein